MYDYTSITTSSNFQKHHLHILAPTHLLVTEQSSFLSASTVHAIQSTAHTVAAAAPLACSDSPPWCCDLLSSKPLCRNISKICCYSYILLWCLQIFAKALAQGHAFGKTATALDVEFLRRRNYTSVYQKIYVKVIGKVLKNEAGYVPLACIETTYSLYESRWLTLFTYKTSVFIYVGTLDFTITVSKGNHYHCM